MVDKKPYLIAIVIRLMYSGYYLLTKIAFDEGMNVSVFVFYRQAIGTLFLLPLTIFFERKKAPPLSFSIFFRIFLLALMVTFTLNVIGVALKYTSASMGASISNSVPIFTFFFSVLLRMETVNLRAIPGIMKALGVFLLIGGIVTMAFYRGPLLKLLVHHHFIHNHLQEIEHHVPTSQTWVKGVFLLLLSHASWALWLVLQGPVLRSYPSKLQFTTLQCFLSTIQSLVVAFIFERDFDEWRLGWNVRLLSVVYCGIVITGFSFYLQAWVIEMKGPVFLAMTTPLMMVLTILISTFLLGEIITLGSVLGALLLVGGLYFVLWGKNKEEKMKKKTTTDVEKTSIEIKVEESNDYCTKL